MKICDNKTTNGYTSTFEHSLPLIGYYYERREAQMDHSTTWDPKTYDEPRRRLVPDFDAFYGTAATLVEMTVPAEARILDLGCGTGLFSEFILNRSPAATVTLLDQSAEMLDVAKTRLQQYSITAVHASFDEALPVGPFDAVISSLAIHHLADDQKARLFQRVAEALADGGIFINADQVAGPSPWQTDLYRTMHEQQARELGTDDAEWTAALERMAIDQYASVDWHLARFADAGLKRCDVFFKRFGFAVMAGWKSSAS